jgi:hypothetical protein
MVDRKDGKFGFLKIDSFCFGFHPSMPPPYFTLLLHHSMEKAYGMPARSQLQNRFGTALNQVIQG